MRAPGQTFADRRRGNTAPLSAWGLLVGLALGDSGCEREASAIEGQVTSVGANVVDLTDAKGGVQRVAIAPVLASQLHPGDLIQADLGADARIERVQFLERAEIPAAPEPGLAVGATLPALRVPGIDGPLTLGAGQGRPTVLGFLYTTCGAPTACPLLAEKLRGLQAEIRGVGRIVTITLDPERDSLDVLRAYAAGQAVDRSTWMLARLDLDALQPLLDTLGVVRAPDNGQILHSQRLLLLDGDGRVVWQSEGNTWEVADLGARLRALAAAPPPGEQ